MEAHGVDPGNERNLSELYSRARDGDDRAWAVFARWLSRRLDAFLRRKFQALASWEREAATWEAVESLFQRIREIPVLRRALRYAEGAARRSACKRFRRHPRPASGSESRPRFVSLDEEHTPEPGDPASGSAAEVVEAGELAEFLKRRLQPTDRTIFEGLVQGTGNRETLCRTLGISMATFERRLAALRAKVRALLEGQGGSLRLQSRRERERENMRTKIDKRGEPESGRGERSTDGS